MKLRLLVLGLLIVVVVSACAPPPVLRDEKFLKDQSLISGEPCSAPCWRGIVPGETKWNEARTIIEDSRDFTNVQVETAEDRPDKALNFDAVDGQWCCRLYSTDGETVSGILTLLAPQMTLSQVIEKYGDPTYFVVEEVTDDQATVTAVYPEIPMIVYVFVAGVTEGAIGETSEIVGALYVTSEYMQTAIDSGSLYKWKGYGKVAEFATGTYDVTPVPTDETTGETTSVIEATAEATAQSGN